MLRIQAFLGFGYICLQGAPFSKDFKRMNSIHQNKTGLKAKYAILLILMITISLTSFAENLKKVISLEGSWRFSIGDDPAWAEPAYDDSDWDRVFVPKSWENNGFDDYNGYAWYRKSFQFTDSMNEETLFLMLGYIDDVDEVYLNGKLIGASGVMPPLVRTAYNILRKYPLPAELLNKNGKNILAVRVFDEYLDGGIYSGPVGIYYDEDNDLLSLNLAGYWDFETTNKVANYAAKMYGQESGKLFVPGFWESRGYPEYDGSAEYSTSFRLPDRFNDENMMIVVGYIDDIDKVYINDTRIGTVTDLRVKKNRDVPNHIILRGYQIPPGLLMKGSMNTIRVKVYDTQLMGGIYEGPIGLITSQNFEELKKQQVEKPYNFWEDFFKSIFE